MVRTYEVAIVRVSALVVFVEPAVVKLAAGKGIGQWWRVRFPLRGIAYAVLVLLLVVLGGQTMKFIYFDF